MRTFSILAIKRNLFLKIFFSQKGLWWSIMLIPGANQTFSQCWWDMYESLYFGHFSCSGRNMSCLLPVILGNFPGFGTLLICAPLTPSLLRWGSGPGPSEVSSWFIKEMLFIWVLCVRPALLSPRMSLPLNLQALEHTCSEILLKFCPMDVLLGDGRALYVCVEGRGEREREREMNLVLLTLILSHYSHHSLRSSWR